MLHVLIDNALIHREKKLFPSAVTLCKDYLRVACFSTDLTMKNLPLITPAYHPEQRSVAFMPGLALVEKIVAAHGWTTEFMPCDQYDSQNDDVPGDHSALVIRFSG